MQNVRSNFIVLIVVLLLIAGCSNIWHRAKAGNISRSPQVQPPIVLSDFQNIGVEKFVKEGLTFAIALYGQPHILVRTVHVKPCKSAYTALNNKAQGDFTLCLGRKPNEYSFWGQLAHEISHLLNAQFFDCYVEGQATLFAEQFLNQKGLDWTGWNSYFQSGQDPFYGRTYFMLKQIVPLLSANDLRQFLSFYTSSGASQSWLHIDINRWLHSLPKNIQTSVRKTILQHYAGVQSALKNVDARYQCVKPS